MEDWLTLPGEDQSLPEQEPPPAEKNPDLPAKSAIVVVQPPEDADAPIVRRGRAPLPIPKKGSFPDLWRKLKPRQRLYLEQLVKAGFNKGRALKACALHGHKMDRHTALRWKNDPTYAKAFEAIQTAVLGEAVNPATMLLQADEILHLAMKPKRVYTKDGRYTGTRERQLETALRANEQKMKATGMLRGDERSTRVTVRLVNLAGLDGQKIIDGQAVEVETE